MGFDPVDERIAIRQAMQARGRIALTSLFGNFVGLPVVQHLQPMFGRAQRNIGRADRRAVFFRHMARGHQRRERGARIGAAQRFVPPAMDQLLCLHEELAFPDAAPPPLAVIARPDRLAGGIMIADRTPHGVDIADLAEIQRAPPDERANGIEEALPQRDIARRRPRADERRLLPRHGGAFIMGNRACNRQRDGAYFGRRAQPQIDAEDIAMHRQVLQQFEDAPPDANGRLGRFLALFRR